MSKSQISKLIAELQDAMSRALEAGSRKAAERFAKQIKQVTNATKN